MKARFLRVEVSFLVVNLGDHLGDRFEISHRGDWLEISHDTVHSKYKGQKIMKKREEKLLSICQSFMKICMIPTKMAFQLYNHQDAINYLKLTNYSIYE